MDIYTNRPTDAICCASPMSPQTPPGSGNHHTIKPSRLKWPIAVLVSRFTWLFVPFILLGTHGHPVKWLMVFFALHFINKLTWQRNIESWKHCAVNMMMNCLSTCIKISKGDGEHLHIFKALLHANKSNMPLICLKQGHVFTIVFGQVNV